MIMMMKKLGPCHETLYYDSGKRPFIWCQIENLWQEGAGLRHT